MTEQNAQATVQEPTQTPLDDMQHNRGADLLKFFLMPFICFWSFGFPDGVGLVAALSGFAIPAFFILSGYFVLVEHRYIRMKKLTRAIQRALLTFGLMAVCYFLLNLALLTMDGVEWMPEVITRRTMFNFFVLNLWPFNIGANIWFIQALLYAYVILLIVNWFWGMKYYKLIMAASMIFMLLAGELAGVIGFRIYDYTYIPGGFLTRALPYVLLGRFLREKTEWLKTVKGWVYVLVFVLGAGLAFGEIYWLVRIGKLVYQGHMMGFGVMAAAVCGWAVSRPQMKRTFFSSQGGKYAKRIYALANPVYYGMLLLTSLALPQFYGIAARFAGIIVYAVCLLLCGAITLIKKGVFRILS